MNYYNDNKQALNDLISDLESGNGISVMAEEDVESELGYASKCHNLEEKLSCPLDVFVKLLFEQKIWIEVNGKMYLTENIDFSIELELQEDETWINTLEDYGEAEFWAWYIYNRNYTDHYTDHVVLRLKDYKKTWWLKEDRSE